MNGVSDTKRFSRLEWLMDNYFKEHIAPIMGETAKELQKRQLQEIKDHPKTLDGILGTMASARMPMGDSYESLKNKGEWNSKTTEDYIAMCKDRVTGSESIQKDLSFLCSEWRSAVVAEIGRERYDKASEQIGCDLAYAYLEQRLEGQMIDRLVEEDMPKTSTEYIIRKSLQSSLFGLPQEMAKSPLCAEIEARGERAYHPNIVEKGAGYTLGAVMDTLGFGAGSAASFVRILGVNVSLSAITDRKKPEVGPTVEMCISQGVFGSEENVFERFRADAGKLRLDNDPTLLSLHNQLLSPDAKAEEEKKGFVPIWKIDLGKDGPQPQIGVDEDIPLVIARGYEEEYLQEQKERRAQVEQRLNVPLEEKKGGEVIAEHQRETLPESATENTLSENSVPPPTPSYKTNENGWQGLSSLLGLNNFGDVTKNLGYVIAMLPDILLGTLTGKTPDMKMKNAGIPAACILCGMFVRNPLLKTLLLGLGGMNILNKATHTVVPERQEQRYKQYADEPLNGRISNLILQGNNLIADIDNVPCSIFLPDKVIDAHRSGALPLNTLANAVLAQNDRMQNIAGQKYEADREQTTSRTIGIQ